MCKMFQPISRTTELRHVNQLAKSQLAEILNKINSWKTLMAIIPSTLTHPENIDDDEEAALKYSADDIKLVANASRGTGDRLAAEILFDEWGTSGRQRPTVAHLLKLLIRAELFRAADYVAMNMLNESVPARPAVGPAARIEIPFEGDEDTDEPALANIDELAANEDNFPKPSVENVQKVMVTPIESCSQPQEILTNRSHLLPATLSAVNNPVPNDQHTDISLIPNLTESYQCEYRSSEAIKPSENTSSIYSANIPNWPALNNGSESESVVGVESSSNSSPMSSLNIPLISKLN